MKIEEVVFSAGWNKPPRKPQGFAKLTPEQRRELASKGGKEAHRKGTAHKFDSETAKVAGKKGNESLRRQYEYVRKEK